jgi:hypothetical protein
MESFPLLVTNMYNIFYYIFLAFSFLFNPSTQKAEAGRSQGGGRSELHSDTLSQNNNKKNRSIVHTHISQISAENYLLLVIWYKQVYQKYIMNCIFILLRNVFLH